MRLLKVLGLQQQSQYRQNENLSVFKCSFSGGTQLKCTIFVELSFAVIFVLNVPGCLQDSLGNPIHWKKASKGRVDGYASTKINACAKSFLHVTVWCNWRGCCPRGFHHLPLRGDYRISCRQRVYMLISQQQFNNPYAKWPHSNVLMPIPVLRWSFCSVYFTFDATRLYCKTILVLQSHCYVELALHVASEYFKNIHSYLVILIFFVILLFV